MSIAIPSFDRVKVSGGLNNTSLYNSYLKFVENDKSLLPSSGKTPTIWSFEKAHDGTGYSKGDAVWINTEVAIEFAKANESALKRYVDSRIPGKVRSLSGDYSSLISYLVDVLEGKENIESPYFLGDITKPVQIRISNKDWNTSKPDDDTNWRNFWEVDSDEKNRKIIESRCSTITEDQLDSHMTEYHLDGSEENIESYLKKTLTNIKGLQEVKSHLYFSKTQGFDFVKLAFQTKTTDGCFRWFRLWNSGMLEHGGVVDVENPYSGDSLEYDNLCYKVALNWSSSSMKAPVYDYQIGGLNSFYDVDTSFRFSSDNEKTERINRSGTLFHTYRYNVQVTPIFENDTNPFEKDNCTEINTIRNDSFCFQKNPVVRMYSYYTSGMTCQNVRRY